MIGSVLNDSARGMINAQRELQKSANEISRANTSDANPEASVNVATEATVIPPVNEGQKSASQRDISEPLIEQRRQEQIFTANASVVQVANETIGSLIDVES
ncbi:MAG: hypothetical protein COA42_11515 [Alteromonadaceae bacterium]|nr:MAG: hypothetical protein COA42_11515 [Alteromonadaceae bacterium]